MTELREAIRARMAIRGHGPIGSENIADAILALPELEAWAERRARERAAEEAWKTAEAYWADTSLARYPEMREWLYARGDALSTDDRAGRP